MILSFTTAIHSARSFQIKEFQLDYSAIAIEYSSTLTLNNKIIRFKMHLSFLAARGYSTSTDIGPIIELRFVNEGIRIYPLIRGRCLLSVADERTILRNASICAQAYNVHGRFCKFLLLINNNNKPQLLLLPH